MFLGVRTAIRTPNPQIIEFLQVISIAGCVISKHNTQHGLILIAV